MANEEYTEDTTLSIPEEIDSVTQSLDVVQDTLAAFLDAASVERVYGKPIRRGDLTIIPAAEVVVGMGFGVGFGSGSSKDGEEGAETSDGEGGGGGGGGKILARPAAIIVASPDGVRVEPVVDKTKIVLAAITAVGFMLATLAGFFNPKESLKNLKGN